jgi:hypothetical protein
VTPSAIRKEDERRWSAMTRWLGARAPSALVEVASSDAAIRAWNRSVSKMEF